MKKIVLLAAFMLTAFSLAHAQNARIQFDNLKFLEPRAADIVEVNIDGKILNIAKNVLNKVDNKDNKKIAEAVKGLEGIYVRIYRFENDNEYNAGDVETIRSQLKTPNWEKLVNVRSKKNNQKIDVYTMFTGDKVSGVTVLISENKSIAVVNVVGEIDIETFAELGGKLSIPEIEIEKTGDQ